MRSVYFAAGIELRIMFRDDGTSRGTSTRWIWDSLGLRNIEERGILYFTEVFWREDRG